MTELVDRRLDDIARRLADRVAIEPRETEPGLARLQEARDWSAARGEFDIADSQDKLLDMLRAQAADQRRDDDVAPVVPLPRGRELDD